jgi:hypothetical protein
LRLYLSPIYPKIIPPIGRAASPTANVENVRIVDTK